MKTPDCSYQYGWNDTQVKDYAIEPPQNGSLVSLLVQLIISGYWINDGSLYRISVMGMYYLLQSYGKDVKFGLHGNNIGIYGVMIKFT